MRRVRAGRFTSEEEGSKEERDEAQEHSSASPVREPLPWARRTLHIVSFGPPKQPGEPDPRRGLGKTEPWEILSDLPQVTARKESHQASTGILAVPGRRRPSGFVTRGRTSHSSVLAGVGVGGR